MKTVNDEALLFKLLGVAVLLALLLIGVLSGLDRPVPESLSNAASAGIGALAMAARLNGGGTGDKGGPDAG